MSNAGTSDDNHENPLTTEKPDNITNDDIDRMDKDELQNLFCKIFNRVKKYNMKVSNIPHTKFESTKNFVFDYHAQETIYEVNMRLISLCATFAELNLVYPHKLDEEYQEFFVSGITENEVYIFAPSNLSSETDVNVVEAARGLAKMMLQDPNNSSFIGTVHNAYEFYESFKGKIIKLKW
jgi:hypothetical protein